MTSYEIEHSLVRLAKQIIKTFGEDTEVQVLINETSIIKKEYHNLVKAWLELYDVYSPVRTCSRCGYISLFLDGINGYSSSVGIDLPRNAFRKQPKEDHYYNITQLIGE